MALLHIAQCRLDAAQPLEAQGAARRARQIFQQLRAAEPGAAAAATEEEVKLFEAEGDVAGQVESRFSQV
eukprot:Skav201385  [mRNA]  locus=scaffold3514:296052:296805:+ [translate_table: standard]